MLEKNIFEIQSPSTFEATALEVFRWQYEQVPVYRKFCDLLHTDPIEVTSVEKIPFLPISFFKTHDVIASGMPSQISFASSGTTGQQTSTHKVVKTQIYEHSFLNGFEMRYGNPGEWAILALLPSYLEREGSSLIYMVDALIKKSKHPESNFYLYDHDALAQTIHALEAKGQKTLLIGVSFALLDLLETHQFQLKHTVVMETGGMKGRRKEMIREELHEHLRQGFGVPHIHSEYGMTELLSQAYSNGKGLFFCPPWMDVLTRDPEDALSWVHGKTGGLNIIDLANLFSCSFIATQDLGKKHADGSFEILGRFDNSDIRGCNLMVSL
ncbi:acyl transferase [Aureisphaera galaxeae]|uniref:LuxE/PaaK family acyltransferase n=1 Tax=Aureisphaera galaxeae TaxID=1538023 RepID=UPI0023509025|nr:acyl transferase [Aureisphaera galaxeae]MDC8002794.1 acyl transferase [Aureisphaera galaxeae]